jgi:hypothetical protein
MQAGWRAALLALLLIPLASCGDKSTAPKPEQVAGTWNATQLVYTSKTTSDRVDLIEAGGTETLVLGADKSFRLMRALPGVPPDTLSGTWETPGDVGDLMVLHLAGGGIEWAYDFALSGDVMSLGAENADYDFNEDGIREAARMRTTLARAP